MKKKMSKNKKGIVQKIKSFYHKKMGRKKFNFEFKEVILCMLITFSFGIVIGGIIMYSKSFLGHHTNLSMNEFISTYSDIVNNYYQDVDKDKLIESGINGMLKYLGDPYSTFMKKEEAEEFDDDVKGVYHGIGAQIKYDEETGKIIINDVFEDSPAAKAGLEEGDILLKVNGEDVTNLGLDVIADKVKGEDGTEVELIVLREDVERIIKLKRGPVDNISVNSNVLNVENRKIGYIYLSVFASNTYKQFKKELERIEKDKIDSLIIDLRGNTGGYLDTVTDILSMFIKKDEVLYQLKTKEKIEFIKDKTDEYRDYPIVVLADSRSASASEVLTASLKETYGAKSVGTKTFGKGKVQRLYQLSSGAVVKYTYQEWLTPNGDYIDKKGIEPDVEVKYEFNANIDNQLDKAVEVIMSNKEE